jgi:hypothetical protein
MNAVLLAELTAADIALVTRDIQMRLRSRFPGLESVVAFDGLDPTQIDATRLASGPDASGPDASGPNTSGPDTNGIDAVSRMLVLWLTYGDASDEMQHDSVPPKRAALTCEERASCVVDALFTQSAECAICLQPHAARAAQLRCGHTFCRACVSEWLERARTCPICRTDVVRD